MLAGLSETISVLLYQPTEPESMYKILVAIAVLALLLGGAYAVGYRQPTDDAQPVEQTGWRTYQNTEIGIVFHYPEKWGAIKVLREEVCTEGLDGPFGSKEAREEKNGTGDPCVGIAVGVDRMDYNKIVFGTFLYTESPLYRKYQPARDGMWTGSVSWITDNAAIETYCSKHPEQSCEVFTNAHGVRIAKIFEATEGMGGFHGWKYFIASPHPFFPALILGSIGPLEDPRHQEFEQLIDSINFVKP